MCDVSARLNYVNISDKFYSKKIFIMVLPQTTCNASNPIIGVKVLYLPVPFHRFLRKHNWIIMTVDNETKNGYHPVQNGDNITAGDKTKEQMMVSEEEAYRDDQLKQEEKCCCGFMQRLASPYLFGVLVCSLYFIQAAAFASNG